MNADLTFNSVVFAKQWDLERGSQRQSIARGINEPDVMKIQSTEYVDSKTKVPGQRFTIRFDRHDLDSSSQDIVCSAYLVLAVPATAVQADLDVLIATFKAAVANADLIANVLAGQT
jgi:hypothetical protein